MDFDSDSESNDSTYDDMVFMPSLTADSILKNVENRFHTGVIYTNVADILISVNPYRDFGLYDHKEFTKYRPAQFVKVPVSGESDGEDDYLDLAAITRKSLKERRRQLPPHIYQLGMNAFEALYAEDVTESIVADPDLDTNHVSILISGESGAGKTEAIKLLLKYFANCSQLSSGDDATTEGAESDDDELMQMVNEERKKDKAEAELGTWVAHRVQLANPVIESFGNAKTIYNDNSSRFGKWVDVNFNAEGRMCGAHITKYLLEESRVTSHNTGEHSFHIFYQLCAATSHPHALMAVYKPCPNTDVKGTPSKSESLVSLPASVTDASVGSLSSSLESSSSPVASAISDVQDAPELDAATEEKLVGPFGHLDATEFVILCASSPSVQTRYTANESTNDKRKEIRARRRRESFRRRNLSHTSADYSLSVSLSRGGPSVMDTLDIPGDDFLTDTSTDLGSGDFASFGLDDLDQDDLVQYANDFMETMKAMSELGFSPEARVEILQVVAGIMHLGNIDFEVMEQTPEQKRAGSSLGSQPTVDSKNHVMEASRLLAFNPTNLTTTLTQRVFASPHGTIIDIPLSVEQAEDNARTLCKSLYGRLFNHILDTINTNLRRHVDDIATHGVGLLDIFGFEIFPVNSFEQLCINYANEKLQQFFIHKIFKLERQLYNDEAIDIGNVQFEDNAMCLQLLESTRRPVGVFPLLSEEIRLPKGSDIKFVEKLNTTFASHKHFEVHRFGRDKSPANNYHFIIHHYAQPVQYTAQGFLDKNRHKLSQDLMLLCSGSSKAVMQDMYAVADDMEDLPQKEIEGDPWEQRTRARSSTNPKSVSSDNLSQMRSDSSESSVNISTTGPELLTNVADVKSVYDQKKQALMKRKLARAQRKLDEAKAAEEALQATESDQTSEDVDKAKRDRKLRIRTLKHKLAMSKMKLEKSMRRKSVMPASNSHSMVASESRISSAAEFRVQLADLLKTLNKSKPFFLRCIKPNDDKQADVFVENLVARQLRTSGMMDAVRIRSKGYDQRMTFAAFARRYECILSSAAVRQLRTSQAAFNVGPSSFPEHKGNPNVTVCRRVCQFVSEKIAQICDEDLGVQESIGQWLGGWQLGKTKVFYRTEMHEWLEVARGEAEAIRNMAVIPIQRLFRGYLCRTRVNPAIIVWRKLRHEFITALRDLLGRAKNPTEANSHIKFVDELLDTFRHCSEKSKSLTSKFVDYLVHAERERDNFATIAANFEALGLAVTSTPVKGDSKSEYSLEERESILTFVVREAKQIDDVILAPHRLKSSPVLRDYVAVVSGTKEPSTLCQTARFKNADIARRLLTELQDALNGPLMNYERSSKKQERLTILIAKVDALELGCITEVKQAKTFLNNKPKSDHKEVALSRPGPNRRHSTFISGRGSSRSVEDDNRPPKNNSPPATEGKDDWFARRLTDNKKLRRQTIMLNRNTSPMGSPSKRNIRRASSLLTSATDPLKFIPHKDGTLSPPRPRKLRAPAAHHRSPSDPIRRDTDFAAALVIGETALAPLSTELGIAEVDEGLSLEDAESPLNSVHGSTYDLTKFAEPEDDGNYDDDDGDDGLDAAFGSDEDIDNDGVSERLKKLAGSTESLPSPMPRKLSNASSEMGFSAEEEEGLTLPVPGAEPAASNKDQPEAKAVEPTAEEDSESEGDWDDAEQLAAQEQQRQALRKRLLTFEDVNDIQVDEDPAPVTPAKDPVPAPGKVKHSSSKLSMTAMSVRQSVSARRRRSKRLPSQMIDLEEVHRRQTEEFNLAVKHIQADRCPMKPFNAIRPIKGGTLQKQGTKTKNWKKRIFLLEGKYLFYYKSTRDTRPRGVISLAGCSVQREVYETSKKMFCFSVFSYRGWNVPLKRDFFERRYYFLAENTTEMGEWMSIISKTGKWYKLPPVMSREKLRALSTHSQVYEQLGLRPSRRPSISWDQAL